jgi:PAS domain S-box-containing protein
LTSYFLSHFVIPMSIGIAVSILVLLYALRHRDSVGSSAFILLMSSITLWQLGYLLWLLSDSPATKILLDKIDYIGVVTVAPAWLLFAFQYAGKKRVWSSKNVILLFIIPFITIVLVWTNDKHWLIWRDYDFFQYGQIILQNVHYGVAFYIHIVYSYALLLIGSLLVIKTVFSSFAVYRRQAALLILGVILPWLGNALYVFKVIEIPGLDLTPFMLGISGILIGFGLYFFRLLSIVPIARKAIIEGTDDGLLILDGNNRIVEINSACRKILRMESPNIIGEQISKAWQLDPEILERYIDVMRVNTEIQIDNGSEFVAYGLHIQPFYRESGVFLGRLITLHDITDMRKMQLEQNRIQKLEMVELMAGGIIHDFNNYISIINGNLKLIEMAVGDSKDISKYVQKIYGATGKANTLTKQLLTFSKGIKPQIESFDLRQLIQETTDLLLSTSQVRCTIDYPENVRPLQADRDLLEQVLSNLIINANQAMPAGGTLDIQVRNVDEAERLPEMLNAHAEYIKVVLRDSGMGIPRDQLPKIFDPYYSTKQKGSGLGLAVCFAIIKKHAGYISVKSKLGKGTTFSIYLPATAA